MNVPDSYLGVWQRTRLKTAAGEDCDSAVFWIQTARLHGDIRTPACTSGLRLTGRSGFAGITSVEDERCQWHRLIDCNPNSGVDIGLMHFENSEKVIELATDDSYLEVWERLPDSRGSQQAFWFEGPEQQRACLLIAGVYFFFGQARLLGVAREGDASQFCFGRIRGGERPWQISHSTNPARIGQVLLSENLTPDPAAFAELGLDAANGWSQGDLPGLDVATQEIHP